MNKKLLLSALLTLPMVAMQIQAAAQVSLGDVNTHVEDTLFAAKSDSQTIESKLDILANLKTELVNCEGEAQDAIERTRELLITHPARVAAQKYNDLLNSYSNEAQAMYRKLAASVQETKNAVNTATEKNKMNNQTLLKARQAFHNALQQVRNPKENLPISKRAHEAYTKVAQYVKTSRKDREPIETLEKMN